MQPWKPDFDASGLGNELYIVGLTPPVKKKNILGVTFYTEILGGEKLIFDEVFFHEWKK